MRLLTTMAVCLCLISCGLKDTSRWVAGPITHPSAKESGVVRDAFHVSGDMTDLRLQLIGGKDPALYAQWLSEAELIDPNDTQDVFESKSDHVIPERIIAFKPSWWGGKSPYDYVLGSDDDCVWIGVSRLEDGTYQYEALRISGPIKQPASVYAYFD